jgi:large subunit ribosomal protein L21
MFKEGMSAVTKQDAFAVIKTGGKQYKVSEGASLLIEKIDFQIDEEFEMENILMVYNSGNVSINAEDLKNCSVRCKVVDHSKSRKVVIFKKKRRQNYRRKNGHRQHLTTIEVLGIKNGS